MSDSLSLPFLKMHGAGNDFAIFDARERSIAFSAGQLEAMAARRAGVGCDQVIVIEPSAKADAFMRIYNADGSEVAACGNATRCVGWVLMEESGSERCSIETRAGILFCESAGERRIRADMGEPRFDWQSIPLSEPRDTLHLGFTLGELSDPAAVSMGNPHMVFTVADVTQAPVASLGPQLEHYPLFPERANVGFAQIVNERYVKLRVWERGSGETLACGTAACAALVALHRRGLLAEQAHIELPGGILEIAWDKASNHVWMTGDVALSFSGLYYL